MAKAFKGLLTGKNQWGSFPTTQPVRTGLPQGPTCAARLRLRARLSRLLTLRAVPFGHRPLQVLSMDGAGGAIFSIGLLRQLDFSKYRDCVTSKAGLLSPLRCSGEQPAYSSGMKGQGPG